MGWLPGSNRTAHEGPVYVFLSGIPTSQGLLTTLPLVAVGRPCLDFAVSGAEGCTARLWNLPVVGWRPDAEVVEELE